MWMDWSVLKDSLMFYVSGGLLDIFFASVKGEIICSGIYAEVVAYFSLQMRKPWQVNPPTHEHPKLKKEERLGVPFISCKLSETVL